MALALRALSLRSRRDLCCGVQDEVQIQGEGLCILD